MKQPHEVVDTLARVGWIEQPVDLRNGRVQSTRQLWRLRSDRSAHLRASTVSLWFSNSARWDGSWLYSSAWSMCTVPSFPEARTYVTASFPSSLSTYASRIRSSVVGRGSSFAYGIG